MATPWVRSSFEPGGVTNVFQLFCFAPAALADVPLSAERFGLPSPQAMDGVEVRELPRELDAAWFDGFRSGALRNVARECLQGDLSGLDAATRVVAVLISRADTADLTHVQAGWAAAQWLVARGATVVLDAQAQRFWKGDDVASWPPGRPFALSTDVNVVVEGEPTASTATLHTRGLQKFGRPDLVVFDVPGARWDPVAALLRAAAARLADGAVFKAGQTLVLGDQRVRCEPYRPGARQDLHLNNDGLELTAGS